MKAFTRHVGLVVPLDRANVDTDAMVPKQFLTSIARTGFGGYLFDAWRYLDRGEPGMDCTHRPRNPVFILNEPRFAGATILLARENFGCGSSREHAVWALQQYGFAVVVAPSFADIFRQNSLNNGLLPVTLGETAIDRLFTLAARDCGLSLDVDLGSCRVTSPDDGIEFAFALDGESRDRMLRGLDRVGMTLTKAESIRRFEARRLEAHPWLVQAGGAATGGISS